MFDALASFLFWLPFYFGSNSTISVSPLPLPYLFVPFIFIYGITKKKLWGYIKGARERGLFPWRPGFTHEEVGNRGRSHGEEGNEGETEDLEGFEHLQGLLAEALEEEAVVAAPPVDEATGDGRRGAGVVPKVGGYLSSLLSQPVNAVQRSDGRLPHLLRCNARIEKP